MQQTVWEWEKPVGLVIPQMGDKRKPQAWLSARDHDPLQKASLRMSRRADARGQDRLAPVAQASVRGRLEDVFQFLLFWSCSCYPQHFFSSLSQGHETTAYMAP